MKRSNYFFHTTKEVFSKEKILSLHLMEKASYIAQSRSGRWYMLPLGLRVQQKLIEHIRKFMENCGATEILTPVLHPKSLWEETNRADGSNFELMSVEDRSGDEFVLGGTAEEMIVDYVRGLKISYKELPFQLYQFSTKFRDELRARGGLLRSKEFVMKDGYSFHASSEDLSKEYEKMKELYYGIFNSLGLNVVCVASDNGYIGGEYSHEFVVPHTIGESRYYTHKSTGESVHEDLVEDGKVQVNDSWACNTGIEVGNIFNLGTHYSDLMKAYFEGKSGREKYAMGCYGIGIGRTLAAIIETQSSEECIVMPECIAPFMYYLIATDECVQEGENIYQWLKERGVDILYDDRNISFGQKMFDSELVGIPYRLLVSKRTVGQGVVELYDIKKKEVKDVSLEDVGNNYTHKDNKRR